MYCVHLSKGERLGFADAASAVVVTVTAVITVLSQLRHTTKPYKNAQNRLLWRDKICLAHT